MGNKLTRSISGYDRYFMTIDLCTALFAAWAVMKVTGTDYAWEGPLEIGWSLILLALFSRRRRDEFADHCWRRATAATFVMLVVGPVLAAFFEGMWEGFRDMPRQTPYDPPLDLIVAILIATFFTSFQWTRFRGGV
jgi:hypothetical protein